MKTAERQQQGRASDFKLKKNPAIFTILPLDK